MWIPRALSLPAVLASVLAFAARPGLAAAQCGVSSGTGNPRLDELDDAPANGVVVFQIVCFDGTTPCFSDDQPPDLPIVDTTSGEAVPGEVVRVVNDAIQTHVVWVPDAPLVVGRTYELQWPAESFPAAHPYDDNRFEALPSIELDVAGQQFEGSIGATSVPSTTLMTCESVMPTECSSRWGFDTERGHEPHLSLEIVEATLPEVRSALDARVVFWSGDEQPPELGEFRWLRFAGLSHTFADAADQYCYRLELRSLIDGATARYEDCFVYEGPSRLEQVPLTEEELAPMVQFCVDPPPGHEVAWCLGSRARCAAAAANGAIAPGCNDLERRCADVERPPPAEPPEQPESSTEPDAGRPSAGAAEDTDAGSANPDAAARESLPEPSRTEPKAEPTRTGGCAVTPRAPCGRWIAPALACIGLAWLGRRRRSRS